MVLMDYAMIAASLLTFYLLRRLYALNEWTLRFVPMMLAVLSYYSLSAIFFKEMPIGGEEDQAMIKKDEAFMHMI
jgi:flagellar biosynthesis protein FliQ